jgi:hypothetical protein
MRLKWVAREGAKFFKAVCSPPSLLAHDHQLMLVLYGFGSPRRGDWLGHALRSPLSRINPDSTFKKSKRPVPIREATRRWPT